MKHTFVLDENIAVCANTGQDDRGNPDRTCYTLINLISNNEHFLAWSFDIYDRWLDKENWLRRTKAAIVEPSFLQLVGQLMYSDQGKLPGGGNPPALVDEDQWSSKLQDDAPFIRLAALFSSFLATTDEPLRTDLRVTGIAESYAISPVSPQEALRLASEIGY